MSCNRTFNVLEMPQKIWLGRKGEMNFRPVSFAWDVWHKEHPGATLSVIYTSPDKNVAPLVVATGTSTPVIWQPTTDVSTVSGYGSVECHLVDGDDVIGISAAAITIIDDSASGTSATAPSWVDQVVRDVSEAASHYPQMVYELEDDGETLYIQNLSKLQDYGEGAF